MDVVTNNLPYFTHHQRPVLLLSPEDMPVRIEHPGVTYKSAGEHGWKGPQTIHRQVDHWKLTLEEDFEWVLLNDADSMCITPELPGYLYSEPDTLWCNVLCHEEEHREDDHPNLNPPYFTHRSVLEKMVDGADALGEIPMDAFLEPHDWGQAIDGFYTHLVMDELKLTWKDFFDGITTWPRGIHGVLSQVRGRGARFIHGIKNSTHLNLVAWEYEKWLREQSSEVRVTI
jgi:hypothetical protein